MCCVIECDERQRKARKYFPSPCTVCVAGGGEVATLLQPNHLAISCILKGKDQLNYVYNTDNRTSGRNKERQEGFVVFKSIYCLFVVVFHDKILQTLFQTPAVSVSPGGKRAFCLQKVKGSDDGICGNLSKLKCNLTTWQKRFSPHIC